ncbi:MAG: hypothetical protein ACP5NC_00795 [Nitrososphaeria archaeon]
MSEFDESVNKVRAKADELKNQTDSEYQAIKEKHLKKLKSAEDEGKL